MLHPFAQLRFVPLALLLALLATVSAQAMKHPPIAPPTGYKGIVPITSDEASGVEISASLLFSTTPMEGFVPVHIVAHNNLPEKRRLLINSDCGAMNIDVTTHWELSIEPRETIETDLFLPLHLYGPRAVPNFSVHVAGFERERASSGLGYSYLPNPQTMYVVLSDDLAGPIWSAVQKMLEDGALPPNTSDIARLRIKNIATKGVKGAPPINKRSLRGSAVTLDVLPADARVLSGVAGLWLSANEWRGLAAARRETILQWIEEGGSLFVGSNEPLPASLPELPDAQRFEEIKTRGFGTYRLVELKDGVLSVEGTARAILALDGSTFPLFWRETFNPPLTAYVSEPLLNKPFTIAFVGLFAAMVGPINLFWLAPMGRRHRLFFTVPLISLAGAVLLVVFIFLFDGLGGWGIRNGLVLVTPDRHRATIMQEQVSQTRLLLDKNFTAPPNASFSRVLIENHPAPASKASRFDHDFSGDWFRSRSRQCHFMQVTLPSRAEVSRQSAADGAPILLSTASGVFREVFYVDSSGQCWRGAALTPGRPLTLVKCPISDLQDWGKKATERCSNALRSEWKIVEGRPGYFFASAEAMPNLPIATLPTIRWERDELLYCGPCNEEIRP